ncbi:glycosyltransferase [Nostoc sp. FACHB-888]|uniref:CgeB family protein n=1 Tax=Nostoc sp. FACHB-888 TaxID=2692842 RepID=UPI001687D7AC|nr:glycosyltransferase [Nostoc sp. FACHB-888]MBD2245417.1 glycosyltransferase [Nostoc sp. FACHB-888]
MNRKILIIGNVSENYQLGSILARASQELGLLFYTGDTNWNSYAPSMKYLWGKGFFKISGKRPFEWWLFNKKLFNLIKELRPQVVLVTGLFPLRNEVFDICSQIGAKIVNYLTDYPWNPNHKSIFFLSNLKNYNLVISTKTKILSELIKHEVKKVHFLPFGYDPFLCHQPVNLSQFEQDSFRADISFIGVGDSERIPFLDAIASLNGFNLKIYGPAWDKLNLKKWQKLPAVFDHEFRLAIYCSNLSLGIVRKRNKDESTMRTFEIAACGGCGIYEDTQEHREILAGYPDYGFFSSPEDLANKCKWLLQNPIERELMRKFGMQIITKDTNTYTSRLKTILDLCCE